MTLIVDDYTVEALDSAIAILVNINNWLEILVISLIAIFISLVFYHALKNFL